VVQPQVAETKLVELVEPDTPSTPPSACQLVVLLAQAVAHWAGKAPAVDRQHQLRIAVVAVAVAEPVSRIKADNKTVHRFLAQAQAEPYLSGGVNNAIYIKQQSLGSFLYRQHRQYADLFSPNSAY
jgi:hypothetical protein